MDDTFKAEHKEDSRFLSGLTVFMRQYALGSGIISTNTKSGFSKKINYVNIGERIYLRNEAESGIMNKKNKKDKVSYYIGWGMAWGSAAGGMYGIMLPCDSTVVYLMGAALGAVIGAIFGKMKIGNRQVAEMEE